MKSRLVFLILMLIVTGNLNRFKTQPVLLAGVEDEAARQGILTSGGLSGVDGSRDLEERILAATVRIELLGWRGTGDERTPMALANRAHATIKDGRYLVTHNHQPILARLAAESNLPAAPESG